MAPFRNEDKKLKRCIVQKTMLFADLCDPGTSPNQLHDRRQLN